MISVPDLNLLANALADCDKFLRDPPDLCFGKVPAQLRPTVEQAARKGVEEYRERIIQLLRQEGLRIKV